MRYRPRPLNILFGLIIGVTIYSFFTSDPFGFRLALTILFLLPIGIGAVIIDYFLQKFLKKYLWTFIIEIFILSMLTLYYGWTQRTKTLIIPDNLTNPYIVTIYGVNNTPQLPKGQFGLEYEIKVPTDGILLTSSDIDSDLPQTKMKTYSGTELNTEQTKLGWVRIAHDKLDCNGKTYSYQFWMVNNSCCMYSNHDIDTFKINLQRQFCER